MTRHTSPGKEEETVRGAGLCKDCQHARIITSDRPSAFLQCQLSFTDSQFAKYPRLPVLTCSGYVKRTSTE
ncbi:MAG: hypothetical protein WAL52_22680 [Candidatus Sulfotelmatobacter sp.]